MYLFVNIFFLYWGCGERKEKRDGEGREREEKGGEEGEMKERNFGLRPQMTLLLEMVTRRARRKKEWGAAEANSRGRT